MNLISVWLELGHFFLTLVPIVLHKWRLVLDRINVENFDAPAYAVGDDANAFVAATELGEMK